MWMDLAIPRRKDYKQDEGRQKLLKNMEKIPDSQRLILEVIFVICSRRGEFFSHVHRPSSLLDEDKKVISDLPLRNWKIEIQ